MYQKTNNPNQVIVECACNNPEHVLAFTLDTKEAELIIEKRFMHYLPWHKRILKAIRYIFGYNPEFMFDCTIINDPEQARKLMEISQSFLLELNKID
jgi:hypothetical protein